MSDKKFAEYRDDHMRGEHYNGNPGDCPVCPDSNPTQDDYKALVDGLRKCADFGDGIIAEFGDAEFDPEMLRAAADAIEWECLSYDSLLEHHEAQTADLRRDLTTAEGHVRAMVEHHEEYPDHEYGYQYRCERDEMQAARAWLLSREKGKQ